MPKNNSELRHLPDAFMVSLGIAVKHLREAKALKQFQLAAEISASTSTISRLESGTSGVDLGTLFHIAKRLDISLTDLIHSAEGIAAGDGLPANAMRMAKMFCDLPSEGAQMEVMAKLMDVHKITLTDRNHYGTARASATKPATAARTRGIQAKARGG